jgi:hypothetical protein
MKTHAVRWALAGFAVAMAIGVGLKVARALQSAGAPEPAEAQPRSDELHPVA